MEKKTKLTKVEALHDRRATKTEQLKLKLYNKHIFNKETKLKLYNKLIFNKEISLYDNKISLKLFSQCMQPANKQPQ